MYLLLKLQGNVKSMCECVLVSRFFTFVFTRENPGFDELWIFTLMEGEKMKREVILPRSEMRAEITKYCFYQTLSMHVLSQAYI